MVELWTEALEHGIINSLGKQNKEKICARPPLQLDQGKIIAPPDRIEGQFFRGQFPVPSARVFKSNYRRHDSNDTGHEDCT